MTTPERDRITAILNRLGYQSVKWSQNGICAYTTGKDTKQRVGWYWLDGVTGELVSSVMPCDPFSAQRYVSRGFVLDPAELGSQPKKQELEPKSKVEGNLLNQLREGINNGPTNKDGEKISRRSGRRSKVVSTSQADN